MTQVPSPDQIELQQLLAFGFDVQDAIRLSLADKKIDIRDFPNFLPMLGSANLAFQNLGNPVKRFRALSVFDRSLLTDYARTRFNLPDEMLEHLIEDTVLMFATLLRIATRWTKYSRIGETVAA